MSSSSNCHHDFERIAVGKRHLVELAARDDFAVAFQRDALAGQFQSCDQFAQPLTIRDLAERLELTGKRIALERNGEIVPRSQFDQVALADGDALEIVVAVGGG